MRKLLIGAGAVLALLVIVALAAPSFVDWNAYRPQLVAAVKEATGRDLAIDGGLELALLPTPKLSAKGLRFASVPGAAEPDMARAEALEVRVALLPLLGGEIKVESVRLIEPAIVLEELADGGNNWSFVAARDAAGDGSDEAPAGDEGGGFALSLDDVEVRDASVTWRSARSGAEERIAGLSFQGSAGSLQGPFTLKGAFERAGRPIAFEAAIGALQAGRAASVRLLVGLKGGAATAEFNGALFGAGADLRLTGKLKAAADDLAKALGETSPLLARPLALEATIDATTAQAAANDLNLRFGETQVGGAVSLALGAEPRFDATLGATRLDLDALLAASGAAPAAKTARATAGATTQEAGDLTLPAGLAGALTATVDGVVYRGAVIRQAQLVAELADGALAVKRLAALLPGGSDAALSGAVTTAGGKPQFDGRLEIASDNLRSLLSWLAIEPAGAPLERLNTASLTAALRVTPELAEMANVNLRLDGSTMTGGAAYRLQERPSFAVDLAIDRLNLDGYLAAPEPGSPAAKGPAPGKAEAQKSGLAALNAFDANVKLRVAQLTYNRAPLKNALLDATLVGGRLALRQASAQDQTGATIKASGSASEFAGAPKFQAELTVAADDLSGLAQLAGLRTSGGAAKLGRTDLKATLDGSFEALGFKAEGGLAGGSLRAQGKASGLQATPAFDATVQAEHKDLVALVRNFGIAWRPAAQNLGGLSVDLAAKGTAAALELPVLKVKAGPASVEGAAQLKLDGARPYLAANLRASEIVLDLFLPAADGSPRVQGGQAAAPGAPPPPAQPAAPRWSREPLDLSALQGLDADVELAARGITFRDYPFEEPRLALALKNGTLRIDELTGKLFQGAVALKGQLASGPQPTLALDVRLDDADIHQALLTAMGLDKVTGRLDFSGAFRAAGRSEWELVNGLAGDAKLAAGEGVLRGVDLAALSRRLAELNGPAAFLDLATRSFSGGETAIRSANGTWQVKNGVATTQDTRAVLEAAEATLVGDVNLAAWRMDLRSEVALTEHPKAPPLAVTLRGPLDSPERDVKTQAMEQYLAARVGSELLRKGLGDKVKELGPLGEILGGGSRQPPSAGQPTQPQQQPAAPPAQQAIEGLLKGLLKK